METICSFHDPKKWGKHVWYVLDLMVIRLDPTDQTLVNHVLMQFISLTHTIPCEQCRQHYVEFIDQNPITLESKLALARWVYNCRSSINTKLNRPNITFDQYLKELSKTFDCDLAPKTKSTTLHNSLWCLDPVAQSRGGRHITLVGLALIDQWPEIALGGIQVLKAW